MDMAFLKRNNTDQLAARLAFQHLNHEPTDAVQHSEGSFSLCYRVKFQHGPIVLVRFPALGRSMFRHEKLDEITVKEYDTNNIYIHYDLPRLRAWHVCSRTVYDN